MMQSFVAMMQSSVSRIQFSVSRMQTSVSKRTGRIVGYFDREPSIFPIVLLDPNHNLQPGKKTIFRFNLLATKGKSLFVLIRLPEAR